MAYAHARGVIHRDLKPSNIMVGSVRRGAGDGLGPGQGPAARAAPPTSRLPGRAGGQRHPHGAERLGCRRVARRRVLGTPAYMAPEQAGGDVEAIDERADVFGLGSILCEILTGRPAYTGPSSEAILRKALRGETADALRRLDGCGADAELVGLAAALPGGRARGAAAGRGRGGRADDGLPGRGAGAAQAAELARAAEEARAEEAQATAAAAERARAAEEARAEEARAAAAAAEGGRGPSGGRGG